MLLSTADPPWGSRRETARLVAAFVFFREQGDLSRHRVRGGGRDPEPLEPKAARTEPSVGSTKGWGDKRTNVSIVIPPSNLSGIATVERETKPFAQATAQANGERFHRGLTIKRSALGIRWLLTTRFFGETV